METEARPASWKILLAFAMIYFVWGSTFLAIRVGVHEVPPFLLAAMRFFTAGLVMYAWLRLQGTPAPSRREWVAAAALGALIFRGRLRLPVLGRAARAFRDCGGGAGDHSGVHHADGNRLPAHATAHGPPRAGAARGPVRRGSADEPFVFAR